MEERGKKRSKGGGRGKKRNKQDGKKKKLGNEGRLGIKGKKAEGEE